MKDPKVLPDYLKGYLGLGTFTVSFGSGLEWGLPAAFICLGSVLLLIIFCYWVTQGKEEGKDASTDE